MSTPEDAPRGRGRPPRISRQLIVDTAAGMDATTLTLQAVADRLGVVRKAITYHVTGRDELLRLAADAQLAEELDASAVARAVDWRAAVHAYATTLHDGLLRRHDLSLEVDTLPATGVLASADALLQQLTSAGFDDVEAGRATGLITTVVWTVTREILAAQQSGGRHPSATELGDILAGLPDDAYPDARRVTAAVDVSVPAQLDFAVDTVLAGLDARLTARLAPTPLPSP
ncbi:hypothetical protein ASG36_20220 [Geodermatophilus sp. Leaf369]|uniref:TetR/AcrR family transcriptional regulator C-terminal domain-containing protein n=1 Tax=Geodermatophilus sp. Leaf369 TaxID=1736354 RepID=UPI0006F56364|nr:TetR/AcrR family transcriptional regulator C-terminal domain-containing protein [Geodermatophilus sp. Leaf369]KQS54774.1 hypothetical protein ASG36_20220 [Geodermatophilus sp. Leaf369]